MTELMDVLANNASNHMAELASQIVILNHRWVYEMMTTFHIYASQLREATEPLYFPGTAIRFEDALPEHWVALVNDTRLSREYDSSWLRQYNMSCANNRIKCMNQIENDQKEELNSIILKWQLTLDLLCAGCEQTYELFRFATGQISLDMDGCLWYAANMLNGAWNRLAVLDGVDSIYSRVMIAVACKQIGRDINVDDDVDTLNKNWDVLWAFFHASSESHNMVDVILDYIDKWYGPCDHELAALYVVEIEHALNIAWSVLVVLDHHYFQLTCCGTLKVPSVFRITGHYPQVSDRPKTEENIVVYDEQQYIWMGQLNDIMNYTRDCEMRDAQVDSRLWYSSFLYRVSIIETRESVFFS